jgi:hypothetical protein
VFADLGQGFSTAGLFYAETDPNAPDVGVVYEFQFGAGTPTFGGLTLPARIYSFGEDDAGELYFTAGPDPRQAPNPNLPAYIVKLLPAGMLNGIAGDVDQNGVFDPVVDVAKFVLGWKTTGHIGVVERYMHGDLNLDGETNLADVFLMHQALQSVNATFPFDALGLQAPEPSTGCLAAAAVAVMAVRCRNGRVRQPAA